MRKENSLVRDRINMSIYIKSPPCNIRRGVQNETREIDFGRVVLMRNNRMINPISLSRWCGPTLRFHCSVRILNNEEVVNEALQCLPYVFVTEIMPLELFQRLVL